MPTLPMLYDFGKTILFTWFRWNLHTKMTFRLDQVNQIPVETLQPWLMMNLTPQIKVASSLPQGYSHQYCSPNADWLQESTRSARIWSGNNRKDIGTCHWYFITAVNSCSSQDEWCSPYSVYEAREILAQVLATVLWHHNVWELDY